MIVPSNPYSLDISWDPPRIPNGIISQYTVYCVEDTMSSGDALIPSVDLGVDYISSVTNDSTSLTVMGLKPFTPYDCYVTANTSAGESEFSSVVSSITEESGKKTQDFYSMLTCCLIIFLQYQKHLNSQELTFQLLPWFSLGTSLKLLMALSCRTLYYTIQQMEI